MTDIKSFLDEWTGVINTPSFIERDPVQFPRRYSRLPDIEVVALLTATITWGNRKMILNSASRMFGLMGQSPFDYIISGGYKSLGSKNIHRTFFENDLAYLCRGLNFFYKNNTSLESVFSDCETMWDGIAGFRAIMATGNNETYSKHISNPSTDSACKRLHLFLRWLVRDDGIVDLGVWKNISPSKLYIPLDVHVGRISRELEILDRKQNDRKSVESLTETLRKICPEDPVKYDFALFGIGEQRNHI
jgi:uncharacterized protein (TIGR02757 family)